MPNDIISKLPVDIGQRIFDQLHPLDLLRAARVCRTWRAVAVSVLWRRIAKPAVTIKPANLIRVYAQSYMSWRKRPLDDVVISARCPIGVEGTFGLFCFHFTNDGAEFMTNNSRGEVFAVDSNSGVTLYQFKELFSCSVYSAPIIYLAWNDIFGFDCESRTCVRTMRGHKDNVVCMEIHDHLLVSGSMDCTVRLWDTASGCLLQLFLGHTAPVHRILFKNKVIISMAADSTAKTWTRTSSTCVHTIRTAFTDKCVPLGVDFDGRRFVFTRNNVVDGWRISGKALSPMFNLRPQRVQVTAVKFIDDIDGCLIVGFGDGAIETWNLNTGQVNVIRKEIKLENGWQSHLDNSVEGFFVHYEFVMSWTRSGILSVHDRISGDFIRELINLPQEASQGTIETMGRIVGVCGDKCRLLVIISMGQNGAKFKLFDFTPRNTRRADSNDNASTSP